MSMQAVDTTHGDMEPDDHKQCGGEQPAEAGLRSSLFGCAGQVAAFVVVLDKDLADRKKTAEVDPRPAADSVLLWTVSSRTWPAPEACACCILCPEAP